MNTAVATSHLERLRDAIARAEIEQLIVGDLVTPSETTREANADLFWLSGFTGTSGLSLVGGDEGLFFTGFRYVERAARELGDTLERVQIERGLVLEAAKHMHGRVGYDEA